MKRLRLLVLALALTVSGTVLATNPSTLTAKAESSQEIKKLLQDPEFIVEHDMDAKVLFTLNEDNEIIVLSVETEFDEVESFVKSRLSFQELEADLEQGKQYIVPVKIKSVS